MALRKGEEWEANGTLMRTTPSPALISEESRAEEARLNAARGATGRARSTIAPKGRRWREEEDKRLRIAVQRHGGAHWKEVAAIVGTRNHVQCLQRWRKVLAPGLGAFHFSLLASAGHPLITLHPFVLICLFPPLP
jgi:hypothetical protein